MADYRFPYRGYNPSYEVDPWNEEPGYTSNHQIRSMEWEPNGRRRYATADTFGQKPTSYLVKTEMYIVHPPAFGGYSYLPEVNYGMNYDAVDDSQWRRSIYDPPAKVEDFLTRVQTEASRPLGPAASDWARNRNPARYEEVYTRYQNDAIQPARSSGPPNPASYGTYPDPPGHRSSWSSKVGISTGEPPPYSGPRGWGRPGWVNTYGRPGQDSKLSKPINDIDTAVEYLKEAINPYGSHTTREYSQQPVPPIPESQPVHPIPESQPVPPIPKSTAPKRDDRQEISGMEDAKPQNKVKTSPETNTTDATSTNIINSREAAKRFNGVLMPKRDAGQEISGMEDAKPQNKVKTSPETNTTDATSMNIINSRDAAKRFNGVLM